MESEKTQSTKPKKVALVDPTPMQIFHTFLV